MTHLHRLASMVRWLFDRESTEKELDDELQAFIELSTADKMRAGVPPAEARRQATLDLVGIEQAKERVRTFGPTVTVHGSMKPDVTCATGSACSPGIRDSSSSLS